jgi:hypothetical protein
MTMAFIEVFTEKRPTAPFGLRKRVQYRWRVRASNNRIIAQASEGYNNLGDLWSAVRLTYDALGGSIGRSVPIHDETAK